MDDRMCRHYPLVTVWTDSHNPSYPLSYHCQPLLPSSRLHLSFLDNMYLTLAGQREYNKIARVQCTWMSFKAVNQSSHAMIDQYRKVLHVHRVCEPTSYGGQLLMIFLRSMLTTIIEKVSLLGNSCTHGSPRLTIWLNGRGS